jgi:hypothetical protein
MLRINKLPIRAGMIRLISHIAKEAAKTPTILGLNNSSTWMLAPHLSPNSVRNVKVGTTAMTRKTTLTPLQTSPDPRYTPKTGKIRLYWMINTIYLPKDKNNILNKIVASKFCKTFM